MRVFTISAVLVLLFGHAALAQRSSPPSKTELAEITERGRQLAAYDVAAWHATDAVQAMNPPDGLVNIYLAMKTGNGWTVAFGRLDQKREKFLIAYEATQGSTPTEFSAKRHDPPKEDTGFYLYGARAAGAVLADFRGENRPYNVAVLPAKDGQMYVYVVPAQTVNGIYPHGGDMRYLVSKDGNRIVEKRQLHRSILEFKMEENAAGGFHTAIMDDIPEDTDVFYVLSRKPAVPELIMTSKYVYNVETDGTVRYLMTREAFQKIKGK